MQKALHYLLNFPFNVGYLTETIKQLTGAAFLRATRPFNNSLLRKSRLPLNRRL